MKDLSQKELAQELYNNFEKITGTKKESVINEDGTFNEKVIDKTVDKLVDYAKKEYNINIIYTDILHELDDILINNLI